MKGAGQLVLFLVLSTTAGCAYPRTAFLADGWSLARGYRFTRIDAPTVASAAPLEVRRAALDRADRVFVVLSFSGGGTRAGALAYGVLAQLEAVKLHLTPEGDLFDCPDWESDDCKKLERSLLDEVDVISSVSGGSFPAAYYALNRKEIFSSDSRFHKRFLFHSVQRDLLASAVYHPRSWTHLGSRVEIASRYYQKHIFGPATFSVLEAGPRPFVVINADDMSTGNRFEFTQDQFDLLCGDLSSFPVARAVTASSAFPGLLNSMTINSHNGRDSRTSPCRYSGPGSPGADEDAQWVEDVLANKHLERTRYRAALALKSYRDPARRYLHLLDGGLADNVGLRAVSEALASGDRLSQAWTGPDQLNFDAGAGRLFGGWSLQQLINDDRVKTLLVIAVNARTEKTTTWDSRARGPSTLAVLGATRGTPMGNFSNETVDRIQEQMTALLTEREEAGRQPIAGYTFEVAFEDIADADEREYFLNLPTSFSLTRLQADCLVDRGPRLLRDAKAINTTAADGGPLSFVEVATKRLFGKVSGTAAPQPTGPCRVDTRGSNR